jgi:hypothetical protein
MSKIIPRTEAIELLAARDLANLSTEERNDLLFCVTHEDWTDHESWSKLSQDVRDELDQIGKLESSDERYDAVLMMPLRARYSAIRNEVLLKCIRALKIEIEELTGAPEKLLACPCCGYQTIAYRGNYDICRVCWWEDDGYDNESASAISGANKISLVEGRANFLKHGIYDPLRGDLRKRQEPPEWFEKEREFVLDASGEVVIESEVAGALLQIQSR